MKLARSRTPQSRSDDRRRFAIYSLFVGLMVLAGVFSANRLRWISDDAFITLRYADNFLAGRGLVFNEGEIVEGYTNFLWLAALVVVQALGFDPVNASQVLGLASYGGILLIAAAISWGLHRRSRFPFPFLLLALIIHYDLRVWATGGLETAFFALLILIAFWTYFFSKLGPVPRAALAGLFLVLGVMTRPDGLLFYLVGGLFLGIRLLRPAAARKKCLQDLLAYGAPLLFIFVPYFSWRYSYYGYPFPNTYYAKSGGGAHFGQGIYYLGLYFRVYVTSAACLLAVGVLIHELIRRRSVSARWKKPRLKAVAWKLQRGRNLILLQTMLPRKEGGKIGESKFC